MNYTGGIRETINRRPVTSSNYREYIVEATLTCNAGLTTITVSESDTRAVTQEAHIIYMNEVSSGQAEQSNDDNVGSVLVRARLSQTMVRSLSTEKADGPLSHFVALPYADGHAAVVVVITNIVAIIIAPTPGKVER
ncbi:uncharacterized protein LOC111265299 [Varroa jacobsoni]|uniref:uncharacterized protein LOC111265299 n=1 Tax=Varroa jacobsoni TaxID=62625 RepID=UPI000BF97B17|nr:uncharacterized protein LOC111265299 [Varroa jacobsoni]